MSHKYWLISSHNPHVYIIPTKYQLLWMCGPVEIRLIIMQTRRCAPSLQAGHESVWKSKGVEEQMKRVFLRLSFMSADATTDNTDYPARKTFKI